MAKVCSCCHYKRIPQYVFTRNNFWPKTAANETIIYDLIVKNIKFWLKCQNFFYNRLKIKCFKKAGSNFNYREIQFFLVLLSRFFFKTFWAKMLSCKLKIILRSSIVSILKQLDVKKLAQFIIGKYYFRHLRKNVWIFNDVLFLLNKSDDSVSWILAFFYWGFLISIRAVSGQFFNFYIF